MSANSSPSSLPPAASVSEPATEPLPTSPGGQPVFPIVGIGASAGGLEALEKFFAGVPASCGLAFVVIQHLDPLKPSALADLLQPCSAMPVVLIADRMRVQINQVYVVPPGVEVTILHGVLHLLKPAGPQGLRLPIDFFLRALAVDQQAHSAAVILSGMGSDGSLGLRTLKESGGGVFVQTPDTARFQGMPRSAVDSRLADVVAPPEELASRVIAYFSHPLLSVAEGQRASHNLNAALEKVLILVRAQTGHDFSYYKKSTVYRRIQRRMAIHQLETVEDYVQYVRNNAVEAELLFKELLIGVTAFFRDPEVWNFLKAEVLPRQLEALPDGGQLRAWVAACSTGEEAYTLAICFAEVVSALRPTAHYSLQIFATDLDKDAIEKARAGFYPDNISGDVSEERLQKFFIKVPGGYCVNKDIRSMVIFAPQSIAHDPPFAKLNILTCRNLMIYLEPELQQRLLQLFHGSLNPGGVLVLGSAETVGQSTDLFTTLGAKTRIYRRVGTAARMGMAGFAVSPPRVGSSSPAGHAERVASQTVQAPSLQVLADQVLLRKFAPSAVLVTPQGDIVYFSGKTSKYLEPPAGKANLNLFAMARRGLSQPLAEVFYKAVREKVSVRLDEVSVGSEGAGAAVEHRFSVTVEPFDERSALNGMIMVVFTDLPSSGKDGGNTSLLTHDARVAELMQELARSREEHQSTREEMQTSQEELKSANEELQSANEELTTSREEMQSMNEELQTVNFELQARVDALARASDDMENLLNSTDIATLFLDESLNVRRFTTRTTGLIKLIPTDVGRPITDIVTELDYPDLATDAKEVLRSLMFREKEVQASAGRWFRVRIMPYRTQDNRIDGVVMTFTDISVAKQLETSLRAAETRALAAKDRPAT